MSVQSILEQIAQLPEAERADLLSRLGELYGPAPAAPQQMGLRLETGAWSGPADYLVVFDGGSQGNPGQGYGSFAIFEGSRAAGIHRLTFTGSLTNNEAEYHTLLSALRHLLDQLGERAATATLEVRGDSALVLQQVLGTWKAKDDRMRALRDEARALLRRFKDRRLVQQPREDTVKVLGH
jgi:ribonuclease HI